MRLVPGIAVVTPTPEQMWGFSTLDEAQRAQQICLNAPIADAMRFLQGLGPDIKAGRVVYVRPANPESRTRGPTMWMEQDDAAETQPPLNAA